MKVPENRNMRILCLGLSHATAELELRERLAFSEEAIRAALARLGCGNGCLSSKIYEMVILSTCNRVEIYALLSGEDFEVLEAFLAEARGVPVESFRPSLYRWVDDETVDHLFRVAAGLDSLVLGEPQILGQVMRAFELARGQNAAGAVLAHLFQAALHAGKRSRSETEIGHNPASISSVAASLAEQVIPNWETAAIGVVGAGEMAELAVEAMRKRGASRFLIANRTRDRARRLADAWGGEALTFEALPDILSQVDLLITSTGAPHTILHADMVRTPLAARQGRPLVIIDIAVPRDVDLEVGALPGVRLFDIDQLQDHLEISLARRIHEVPRVEAILKEEKASFLEYLRSLDVTPLIAEMHQKAEQIRQAELEKTLRRLPDLTPEERERLEALTEALVKKILHAPTTCLRQEAGTPEGARRAAVARDLFQLNSRGL